MFLSGSTFCSLVAKTLWCSVTPSAINSHLQNKLHQSPVPFISIKFAFLFFRRIQEKMIQDAIRPTTKLQIPTTTGTHTATPWGHSGLGGGVAVLVVESVLGGVLVVESGSGDAVAVLGGVGTSGLRLLTLVKIKGLAYWKHKTRGEQQF